MFETLQLSRPIIFFDLETTGIDVKKDRIIDISMRKLNMDGKSIEKRDYRFNPQMPIHPKATEVHGISDEMVVSCPTFKEMAPLIHDFIMECDFAGFNIKNYDLPMLAEEFCRAYIELEVHEVNVLDMLEIFKHHEKRDLSSASRFYLQKEHTGAHGAAADTDCTVAVFAKQLEMYSLSNHPRDLADGYGGGKRMVDPGGHLYRDNEGIIRFVRGKNKDVEVQSEPGYCNWMLKENFPEMTKRVLKKILDGKLY